MEVFRDPCVVLSIGRLSMIRMIIEGLSTYGFKVLATLGQNCKLNVEVNGQVISKLLV